MPRPSHRRRTPGGFREINLTPLVDVMLVLLIVFMITAPLLTSGLPVELPNVSADPAPLHDDRFVISVTAEERVFYDDRDVTDDVYQTLSADDRLSAARTIYVRADRSARYGAVARVVAAARAAGLAHVSLVVEPLEL
jgi:biopolymer transport protein TolR